jgi:hypothetical protein
MEKELNTLKIVFSEELDSGKTQNSTVVSIESAEARILEKSCTPFTVGGNAGVITRHFSIENEKKDISNKKSKAPISREDLTG